MKKYFIFIVFSEVINQFLGNKIGFCSDTSIGEPLKCCANYRQVGKTCEECWPGTYGINCTPCPLGFYGRLCILSCHNLCTSCDPVTGCTDFTATGEIAIDSGKIIRALLGGFGGIVAILVGMIIWKKCLKTPCPTLHVYDESDLGNEAFEEQFNYDALQKNEEYEVVRGQEDLGTESVQQINSGQNMYIDVCD